MFVFVYLLDTMLRDVIGEEQSLDCSNYNTYYIMCVF